MLAGLRQGEEIMMGNRVEIAWVRLAVVAGGVAALTVVARGISSLVVVALGEVNYHAEDPKSWARWLT